MDLKLVIVLFVLLTVGECYMGQWPLSNWLGMRVNSRRVSADEIDPCEGRQSMGGGKRMSDKAGECKHKEKVWLFSSGDGPNFAEYVLDDHILDGFNVGLVEKVCKIAGKKCEVVLSEYSDCMVSNSAGKNRPGPGLNSRWYDACIAWGLTTYRNNFYDFTKPFAPSYLGIFVRNDSEDFTNLNGKKIAFVKGWLADPDCLTKQGETSFVKMWAENSGEARAMVLDGRADGLYLSYNPYDTFIDGFKKLDVGSDASLCVNGMGILVTKDSPLPKWWDTAFDSFVASGGYKGLCANYHEKGRQMYKKVTGNVPAFMNVCL